MIQYDWNDRCKKADVEEFLSAMGHAGFLSHLPERLIDAGSAVSGSGPAFAAMFIEAMADGGVVCGLPRATAMEYAARTLIGTAELMLQSGDHPGKMKDAVCSPGGSTIEGVRVLERGGFRSAVTEAIVKTWRKIRNLPSKLWHGSAQSLPLWGRWPSEARSDEVLPQYRFAEVRQEK